MMAETSDKGSDFDCPGAPKKAKRIANTNRNGKAMVCYQVPGGQPLLGVSIVTPTLMLPMGA